MSEDSKIDKEVTELKNKEVKDTEEKTTRVKRVRKNRKQATYSNATIYVSSTSNNTILTAVNQEKKVFAWASPGVVKFKGTRKNTPYAIQEAANYLSDKLDIFRVKNISFVLKGIGNGKESAIKTFQGRGFMITEIIERTNFPFNGCRLPRRRRV